MKVLKDYNNDIKWNIGSLINHYEFVWYLLDICKNLGLKPSIEYVFGGVPCLFQGGRIVEEFYETSKVKNIIDGYNRRGIGCRLTFSNPLIQFSDLNDNYCNQLLQMVEENNSTYMKDHDNKNGVIISSDLLNEHIKEHYPSLERISSQVKPSVEVGLGPFKDTVDYYNKLFDSYDIVVINPMKAYDDDFLKKVKYPNKVEFIANCKCVPNCPHAKDHYEALSDYQMEKLHKNEERELNIINERISKIMVDCSYNKSRNPLTTAAFFEGTIDKLIKLGFNQFKLEGRENPTICFSHDIGIYIFEPTIYNSIEKAIMEIGGFQIYEGR